MTSPSGRGRAALAACVVLVWSGSAVVSAQSPGPLTGTLPLDPPAVQGLRLGPVQFTPAMRINEIGIDTNVFDEATDPKEDFVVSLSPDLDIFVQLGLVRVTARSGSEFTYYKRFASERSVSRQLRARVDGHLSRIRLWATGALVQSRQRPNSEIDARARREERETSAGVGFDISPLARAYVAVVRTEMDFETGVEFGGVSLETALDRRTESVQGGLRFEVTPLTTMTVYAAVAQDRFSASPERNADSRSANLELAFDRDAIFNGRALIAFFDFQPTDPGVRPYQGLTTEVRLSSILLGRATLELALSRGTHYSFEQDQGYFVQSGAELTFRPRLYGPFDVQFSVGREWLEYGRGEAEARDDRRVLYRAGVGYNLKSLSRIGFDWEIAERDSELDDRRFDRRRFFASFTQRF